MFQLSIKDIFIIDELSPEIFEEVQFDFAKKRIVELFQPEKSKRFLLIYRKGLLQSQDFKEEEREDSIDDHISNIILARNTQHGKKTLLVLQDKHLKIVGLTHQKYDDFWQPKFVIEAGQYRLQTAHGLFLVALSVKDYTMMLIEVGGPQEN